MKINSVDLKVKPEGFWESKMLQIYLWEKIYLLVLN